MKNYLILGLLGIVILAVISTQTIFKKNQTELADGLSQNQTSTTTKSATMMLDPETGEIMTDPEKIDKLSTAAPESTTETQSEIKGTEMTMTEMDDGALKIDLGKRFIRPNRAAVDEHGNVIEQDHTELESQESE